MSDLIERLRDKKRLRAAHGLTGWVLAEEALLAQAADEIERLRQWETCGQEWLCKTDWVQERVNAGSWPISALGKHRADVMREEIERLTAERDELRRQLAEAEQTISALQDALRTAVNAAMGGGDAG